MSGSNTITTINASPTAAFSGQNLIFNGDGSLIAFAINDGYGISATSIKLQYNATLICAGELGAANVEVMHSSSVHDIIAGSLLGGGNSVNITQTDYRDNIAAYKYIAFTLRSNTINLPVYVNNTQVTNLNKDNVLGDGSVSYTGPSGSTPAILTLNNANITNCFTATGNACGIYADRTADHQVD